MKKIIILILSLSWSLQTSANICFWKSAATALAPYTAGKNLDNFVNSEDKQTFKILFGTETPTLIQFQELISASPMKRANQLISMVSRDTKNPFYLDAMTAALNEMRTIYSSEYLKSSKRADELLKRNFPDFQDTAQLSSELVSSESLIETTYLLAFRSLVKFADENPSNPQIAKMLSMLRLKSGNLISHEVSLLFKNYAIYNTDLQKEIKDIYFLTVVKDHLLTLKEVKQSDMPLGIGRDLEFEKLVNAGNEYTIFELRKVLEQVRKSYQVVSSIDQKVKAASDKKLNWNEFFDMRSNPYEVIEPLGKINYFTWMFASAQILKSPTKLAAKITQKVSVDLQTPFFENFNQNLIAYTKNLSPEDQEHFSPALLGYLKNSKLATKEEVLEVEKSIIENFIRTQSSTLRDISLSFYMRPGFKFVDDITAERFISAINRQFSSNGKSEIEYFIMRTISASIKGQYHKLPSFNAHVAKIRKLFPSMELPQLKLIENDFEKLYEELSLLCPKQFQFIKKENFDKKIEGANKLLLANMVSLYHKPAKLYTDSDIEDLFNLYLQPLEAVNKYFEVRFFSENTSGERHAIEDTYPALGRQIIEKLLLNIEPDTHKFFRDRLIELVPSYKPNVRMNLQGGYDINEANFAYLTKNIFHVLDSFNIQGFGFHGYDFDQIRQLQIDFNGHPGTPTEVATVAKPKKASVTQLNVDANKGTKANDNGDSNVVNMNDFKKK